MPVYRRSILCPECKVMHKKLPEHLRAKHGFTKERAKLIAKEERMKLNTANSDHHVVHGHWVRSFLQEMPMDYARACDMLRAVGHVIKEEIPEETAPPPIPAADGIPIAEVPDDAPGDATIYATDDAPEAMDDAPEAMDDVTDDVSFDADDDMEVDEDCHDYHNDTPRKYGRETSQLKQKLGLFAVLEDNQALADFRNFLKTSNFNRNEKRRGQIERDVSRIFAFCQRKENLQIKKPDLQALKTENLESYFQAHTDTKSMASSRLVAANSLTAYITYIRVGTSLTLHNDKISRQMEHLSSYIALRKKGTQGSVQIEKRHKRFEQYQNEDPRTPYDCVEVLRAGKARATELSQGAGTMNKNDHVFFTRYLLAVLGLKHCQRASVGMGLRVEEYNSSKTDPSGKTVYAVRDHKTGNHQVAQFALSSEDRALLDGYHRRVTLASSNAQAKAGNHSPANRILFFVRFPTDKLLAGQISSPSDEIRHLQEELNVPPITTNQARHAMQTTCNEHVKENDTRQHVCDYLAHTPQVAKTSYRDVRASVAVKVGAVFEEMTSKRGDFVFPGASVRSEGASGESKRSADHFVDTERFFAENDVTSESTCPRRQEILPYIDLACQDRNGAADKLQLSWRYKQLKIRQEYLTANFKDKSVAELQDMQLVQKWQLSKKQLKDLKKSWK